MPAYTDRDRMVRRYGLPRLTDLTDREPYAGTVNDAVLGEAVASAGSVIDSFLGTRYRLPLDPVPDVVRDVADKLAFAALYVTEAPDKVTADFNAAMKLLRDLADGRASIDAPGSAAVPAGEPVVLDGPTRAFGRDRMRGW